MPSDPRPVLVGDRKLSPADRRVLAVWSGQPVPPHGEVRLTLSTDQTHALKTLLAALGK